jgi:hypothetical protein
MTRVAGRAVLAHVVAGRCGAASPHRQGPVRLSVIVAGCLFGMAASADASIVRVEANPLSGGKVVVYRGAEGEVNRVFPQAPGAPAWDDDFVGLQDGYGESTNAIMPEAPCTSGLAPPPSPPQTPNFARCPSAGVDLISADLGDQNDRFGPIGQLPVLVHGGAGSDDLGGGDLDDVLLGEEGADALTGGPGDDILDGGPGPDRIAGDIPASPAYAGGGAGRDTVYARDGEPDDVSCGDGTDIAFVDTEDAVAPDCETVQRLEVMKPLPLPVTTVVPDRAPPIVSTRVAKRPSLRSIIARGLRISVGCSEACDVKAELQISRALARSLGLPSPRSDPRIVIGRALDARIARGSASLSIRPTAKARKALRRLRRGQLSVQITATDAAGNAKHATTSVRPTTR